MTHAWIVEAQLDRRSPWLPFGRARSRLLAETLASWARAGGYRTRIRKCSLRVEIPAEPEEPGIERQEPSQELEE
jgi:hypothetical protein